MSEEPDAGKLLFPPPTILPLEVLPALDEDDTLISPSSLFTSSKEQLKASTFMSFMRKLSPPAKAKRAESRKEKRSEIGSWPAEDGKVDWFKGNQQEGNA